MIVHPIIPALTGVLISLTALFFAAKMYRAVQMKAHYSSARLFLKRSATIYAMTIITIAIMVFIIGRMISFLIIFGFLSESMVESLRAPVDFISSTFITYGLFKLYTIVRIRKYKVKRK